MQILMSQLIHLSLIQLARFPKSIQTHVSLLSEILAQHSFHLQKSLLRTVKSKHLQQMLLNRIKNRSLHDDSSYMFICHKSSTFPRNHQTKSVKSVFKETTHHASTSISVFPKNKIRAIRKIRVQENNPSRININLRIPQKQNPCYPCNPCSKKPTHHASISIYVFPQKRNPCYPCNPCSKKPTHHAMTLFSAFPKTKSVLSV